ncbi:hypothetical protein [Niastella sp. OAS944]|uniref:hypothetical protein n=1 Tax=Niastella sp. OAS944 TaxID=2664089 RepID=UPI003489CA84|nr:hypothetical protein [Chitinophagaceae bacterium OAS944]
MISSFLSLFLFYFQGFSYPQFHPIGNEKGSEHVKVNVDYRNVRKVPVPRLVGLPLFEAMQMLRSKKLEVGLIFADDQIKNFTISDLIVYIQNPKEKYDDGRQNYIHKGEQIDLWITDDRSKIKK